MKRKVLFTFFAIILGMLIWLSILILQYEKPPHDEIENARRMLYEANKANATEFASSLFLDAKNLYSNAMAQWELENNKPFYKRNFKTVSELCAKSSEKSLLAISLAKKNLDNNQMLASEKLVLLKNKISVYVRCFYRIPLNQQLKSNLLHAGYLLSESEALISDNNYIKAIEQLDSALYYTENILNFAQTSLEEYMLEFPKWEKMIKKALAQSQKNANTVVIVDKLSGICMLFKSGIMQKTFDAELGPNWMGDKMHQGDKRTPEGFYTITRKKKGGETKFYKALLLNYPAIEDMERYKNNKKNGIIPEGLPVGSLIEIHGHGGKGIDWTEGCVALKNEDMDYLYKNCPQGTSILIVGSTKPLYEIYAKCEYEN